VTLDQILNQADLLSDAKFVEQCVKTLEDKGVLVLADFISPTALQLMKEDSASRIGDAYFCATKHNVYLQPTDESLPIEHPRNREVVSSKGLIADDQVPEDSPLKTLYKDETFKMFIASVVGEGALHPYADPMSSVNVHFAKTGQELGWHFDNSSFAITLLIDAPQAGGEFEYVKDLRKADAGELNFEEVGKVLDGYTPVTTLDMQPGALVLFRGRNSMHRVTPTIGEKTRILAVLAYNSEPGISLSESARQTFYGRLN